MSPPFFVPLEESLRPRLRLAKRLGPLIEELDPALGDRIRPLAVRPLGGDEALLLQSAQEAIEVAHLDTGLAGQLRQALEEVVAVRRPLAQEEQERRLREPLDTREHVPAAAEMAACPGSASHALICITHMYETIAYSRAP